MCPVCLTSLALAVAGGTSAGGLTALVIKKLRAQNGAKKSPLEMGNRFPKRKEKSS